MAIRAHPQEEDVKYRETIGRKRALKSAEFAFVVFSCLTCWKSKIIVSLKQEDNMKTINPQIIIILLSSYLKVNISYIESMSIERDIFVLITQALTAMP